MKWPWTYRIIEYRCKKSVVYCVRCNPRYLYFISLWACYAGWGCYETRSTFDTRDKARKKAMELIWGQAFRIKYDKQNKQTTRTVAVMPPWSTK